MNGYGIGIGIWIGDWRVGMLPRLSMRPHHSARNGHQRDRACETVVVGRTVWATALSLRGISASACRVIAATSAAHRAQDWGGGGGAKVASSGELHKGVV